MAVRPEARRPRARPAMTEDDQSEVMAGALLTSDLTVLGQLGSNWASSRLRLDSTQFYNI